MAPIEPNPTPQAEWFTIVNEAQERAGYQFHDDISHYLVVTLNHFTQCEQLSSKVIALDFLQHQNDRTKTALMRETGDHCLLLSGLFPERVYKKNVSLHYMIGMGRNAYALISNHHQHDSHQHQLFHTLSFHFVGLIDVLHHMRYLDQSPVILPGPTSS